MRKREIAQLGIVVRDIQKAMEGFWEILGIGPWDIYTFSNETVENFTFYGKPFKQPFKYIIAKAILGNIEFELIQHIEGPTIYKSFLKEKGEGLHHIKEKMDDGDLKETLKKFKQKGIEIIQSGKFGENVHYYLNTEPELGIIYEIGNYGKIKKPDKRYPPEI